MVERDETWVAGLPVRSPRRPLGHLRDQGLESAWAAVLNQEMGGPLASAYVDWSADLQAYNTQVVGYQCRSLDEATRGHVIVRVPAGGYAKFSSLGEFPQVMTQLWEQIDYAESHKLITRTHRGDFECYPHAYAIDLYLSVDS
jgi:predicted transcriptional regulator YdeE